ncbi:hypothetical protein IEQ34_023910 [Dendrobium chrysotoxum]|uniref:NADH:quinone oxidoreductase/Mrp antiporter transmembrane domain-containing protein n=1 Tax=Dendrobium chrysotoxum TaxID=161865 RepID=A0AAV7FUS8_DENCH|nr:hypothetical protein IEQ34_023910 [Dendrobium chrysotoxum]
MDQSFDFHWRLGTDGLSIGPILLTGFLTTLATLAAWPNSFLFTYFIRKKTPVLGYKVSFVHCRRFHFSLNRSSSIGNNTLFGFLIAYAVKSPMIPLHTWLPDTHGEAHYSTCMLLAGIL